MTEETKAADGAPSGVSESTQLLVIGDLCRTTEGAPARYLVNGRAMYISAMCNEVCVSRARPATGGEDRFPLPDDDDMVKHA